MGRSTLTRRSLLENGAAGLALLPLSSLLLAASRSAGQRLTLWPSIFLPTSADGLGVYQLARQNFRDMAADRDENWHSLVISADRRLAIVLPKTGSTGLAINLAQMSISYRFSPADGFQLYGHGCFLTPTTFVCSESTASGDGGIITVRDLSDGRILDRWDSGGLRPHDCQMDRDGKHLLVANTGGYVLRDTQSANLAVIDTSSGKILSRITCDAPDQIPAHFTQVNGDTLVLGCIPAKNQAVSWGAVMVSRNGGAFRQVDIAPRFKGILYNEVLSLLSIGHDQRVVVTYPKANAMSLVDVSGNAIVATLSLNRPRALALSEDGRRIMVVHESASGHAQISWLVVDGDSLSIDSTQAIPDAKSMAHTAIFDGAKS